MGVGEGEGGCGGLSRIELGDKVPEGWLSGLVEVGIDGLGVDLHCGEGIEGQMKKMRSVVKHRDISLDIL
ncbi:hypothetical protein L1987_33759 [Smallanthus sonchifolius]|uniref:Uncharacterized protein n=1 Tax=Smallanthus sonchifolius TaxID=185202 RepID=A0ACB9HSD0_9ASTR|nr:hypothetical protein L1987_33759 [Smallanthus sonchifolius]